MTAAGRFWTRLVLSICEAQGFRLCDPEVVPAPLPVESRFGRRAEATQLADSGELMLHVRLPPVQLAAAELAGRTVSKDDGSVEFLRLQLGEHESRFLVASLLIELTSPWTRVSHALPEDDGAATVTLYTVGSRAFGGGEFCGLAPAFFDGINRWAPDFLLTRR